MFLHSSFLKHFKKKEWADAVFDFHREPGDGGDGSAGGEPFVDVLNFASGEIVREFTREASEGVLGPLDGE